MGANIRLLRSTVWVYVLSAVLVLGLSMISQHAHAGVPPGDPGPDPQDYVDQTVGVSIDFGRILTITEFEYNLSSNEPEPQGIPEVGDTIAYTLLSLPDEDGRAQVEDRCALAR